MASGACLALWMGLGGVCLALFHFFHSPSPLTDMSMTLNLPAIVDTCIDVYLKAMGLVLCHACRVSRCLRVCYR